MRNGVIAAHVIPSLTSALASFRFACGLGCCDRCTQAFFFNYALLPPQYASFSDSHPYPKRLAPWRPFAFQLRACDRCEARCPPKSELDESDDPSLYDEEVVSSSPILKEVSIKLPTVALK